MFRAELRYLQTTVAGVNNLLMHAFHLVAQHNGVAPPLLGREVVKHRAAFTLFHGHNPYATALQFGHGLHGRPVMPPADAVLGAEGRLVYFRVRRHGGYSAQQHFLNAEGVARAQHRTHVIHAAHVVEHDDERQLVSRLKLVHRQAVHLRNT